jgi:hypothetical protein
MIATVVGDQPAGRTRLRPDHVFDHRPVGAIHSGKWTWQDEPLLLAIDTGGHLLCLVAMGAILGAWRRK